MNNNTNKFSAGLEATNGADYGSKKAEREQGGEDDRNQIVLNEVGEEGTS
jgi:hypothetical protein